MAIFIIKINNYIMSEPHILNAYNAKTESLDAKQIMLWPGNTDDESTRVDLLSLFRDSVMAVYNFPFTVSITGEQEATHATGTLTILDFTLNDAALKIDNVAIALEPSSESTILYTIDQWVEAINDANVNVVATIQNETTILLTATELGDDGNTIQLSVDDVCMSASGTSLTGGIDESYIASVASGSIYLADNEYIRVPQKDNLLVPKEGGPYYISLSLNRDSAGNVEYEYIVSNDIENLGYNIIIPIEK